MKEDYNKNFWHKFYRVYLKIWRVLLSLVLIASAAGIYFFFFAGTETVKASWWNDSWLYRKALTINHAQVAGDLVDFPVLVLRTDSDFIGKAQDDGGDFVFTLNNGTVLKHEIESYASSTGALVAWVKMPALSSTADADIFLYYGNANVVNQETPQEVWDENYLGVWHMSEDPSQNCSGNYEVCDSTKHAHNADANGTMTAADQVAGQINGNIDFDISTADYLSTTDINEMDGSSYLTMSVWVKIKTLDTFAGVAGKGDSGTTLRSELMTGGIGSGGSDDVAITLSNGESAFGYTDENILVADERNYWTAVFDGSQADNGTRLKFYFNGSQRTLLFGANPIPSSTAATDSIFNMGSNRITNTIDAEIDEIRVSIIPRSATWIETEYNNQSDPASFFSVQAEEVGPGPVGYWSFDEGYGTTAHDESGQGNDGTITGALWKDGSECVSGRCLWFDGANDNVLAGVESVAGDSTPIIDTVNLDVGTNSEQWATGWTFTHTVPAGTDLLVLFMQGWEVGAGCPPSTTYNGDTLTNFPLTAGDWGDSQQAVWYRLNPDVGANQTIAIDGGCSLNDGGIVQAINISGVDTTVGTNGIRDIDDNFSNSDATITLSPTTALNDLIIAQWSCQGGGLTTGHTYGGTSGTQNEEDATAYNDDAAMLMTSEPTGSGQTVTFNENDSGNGYPSGVAISVAGEVGGGATTSVPGLTVAKTVSFWAKPASDTVSFLELNNYAYVEATNGQLSATGFASPTIYVNGALSSTLTVNEWQFISITTNTAIDASGFLVGEVNGSYFFGFIDEVKIYPYVRSADQIKQDYSAGLAGVKSNTGVSAAFGGASDKWLTDGLVGYWKFDEAVGRYDDDNGFEDAIDSSGNGFNGDANFNASTTAGKFGNAAVFDENNDVVNTAGPVVGDDYTVSFWMHTNDETGGPHALVGDTTGYIVLYYYDNSSSVCNWNSSISFAYGLENHCVGTVAVGEWNHVIVVNNNGNAKYYINGIESGSTEETPGFTVSTFGHDNSGSPNEFNGRLDEVRIYNRAFSPDEVRKLYEWAPGPVAHWKFDEMSGATAFDSVASSSTAGGNDGSVSGAEWANGKYGGALNFDGNNNNVSCGSKNIMDNLSQRTICSWVKAGSGAPSWQILVDKSENGLNGWNLYLSSSNQISFYQGFSSGEVNIETSSFLTAGKWQHLCVAYDGEPNTNGLDVYVDGISIAIPADTAGSSIRSNDSGFSLNIGNSNDFTNDFIGQIDDVRIYNYARTQKQILEDMSARGGSALGGNGALNFPVLHLSFDEGLGGTAHDSSIHGHDGLCYPGLSGDNTSSSSMWAKNGKVGGGMEFDGEDDYVGIGSHPDFDLEGEMSVCAWFMVDALNTDYHIVGQVNSAGTDSQFFLDVAGEGDNNLVFGWGNSGDVENYETQINSIAATSWYHGCAVRVSDSQVRFFINGKESAVAAVYGDTNIPTTAEYLSIGRSGAYNGYYFDGLIDEVKIWNYALVENEIKTVYNDSKSAVMGLDGNRSDNSTAVSGGSKEYCIPGDMATCTPPVLELKMDELSGTTTYDTSGNGINGVFPTSAASPSWQLGKFGSALKFDGNDYVVIADNANQDTGGKLTVSHWFKTDPGMVGKGMVMHDNSDYKYMTYMTGSSSLISFYVKTAAGTINIGYDCGPDDCFTDGKWHHFSGTFDRSLSPNRARVYVDGILKTELPGYDSDILAGDEGIYIGRWGSAYYSGFIDEVRIYNYARTPAQIAWDYNRGKPVAHWRFDECEGSVIHDYAGTNHGTLNLGTSGTTATGTCASSSDSFWYNGRSGKYKSGGSFDGTDDYVIASDEPSNSGLSAVTLSAWVKADNWEDTGFIFINIVGKGNSSSEREYRIRYVDYSGGGDDQLLTWQISNDGDDPPSAAKTAVSAPLYCPAGSWCHLLGTYDDNNSDKLKFYMNGELVAEATGDSGGIYDGTANFAIGDTGDGGGDEFDGQIDEVKIWNYALTDEQIKQEYNGGAVRFGE
ncbi:hypothetical protein A2303_06340 [Candidatus Falkowbacteria bacterium RIFOXYB2_FULL_47_14]|uniref:LamG-like jellyroll fold domain-containing protein n=1 Tax=Candidatus Falkowbacteria bacterium RIFOXYA2_FULL_47_19 TaxID=1797994 RepID=A0A1F5SKE6_9BACT|nr:MAG: hypothetical protein A2227_06015 [Candidatus Falkowbacteria bacterium RIFOXYA2_FULL_47_19]OGF35874.1 MAG: hypothetical protein A2468_04890 [Candidatus Falkowbacteria bacterium RIFOXYC2_FULL_46_15]OGF43550.1 MAG: hypothetical protein A2303_06340 [Candidatus Falkowbacteria bacterium RIFOXYB2_FULL_47_14]